MSTVFDALDEDWRRLRGDTRAARHLVDVCKVAGAVKTLREVELYVRSASAADADRVLLALVARSRRGRPAGSRVLLQMLMPGTRRMARRWWALGDADERAGAAAVAAVYHRIHCYPLARRPGRVATNILLDAERERRRAAAQGMIAPVADPAVCAPGGHRHDDEPVPHPAVELTEVLRDAVDDRVIEPGDAELIARSRIGGERVVDLAERRGAATRTSGGPPSASRARPRHRRPRPPRSCRLTAGAGTRTVEVLRITAR